MKDKVRYNNLMDIKTKYARELRKTQTPQEEKLWKVLRNRRYKNLCFKRQRPIGEYIVDFVCREKKLIIEIDGGQHNEEANIDYDNKRTKYLEEEGYTVLRFWNNEVDNNIEGVFKVIDSYIK